MVLSLLLKHNYFSLRTVFYLLTRFWNPCSFIPAQKQSIQNWFTRSNRPFVLYIGFHKERGAEVSNRPPSSIEFPGNTKLTGSTSVGPQNCPCAPTNDLSFKVCISTSRQLANWNYWGGRSARLSHEVIVTEEKHLSAVRSVDVNFSVWVENIINL